MKRLNWFGTLAFILFSKVYTGHFLHGTFFGVVLIEKVDYTLNVLASLTEKDNCRQLMYY